MDVSTFYALFSATCFASLGFWWNLINGHPEWLRDPPTRAAVGGVYLSFLLPALMGLFAQVGGTGTTTVWRLSFVAIALVGAVTTSRALRVSGGSAAARTPAQATAVGIYVLVAVIGVAPEIASVLSLAALQAEALLLSLLVLVAHGLVWRFMTAGAGLDARPGLPTAEGRDR